MASKEDVTGNIMVQKVKRIRKQHAHFEENLFLHKQVEVIADTLMVCGTLLFIEASTHGQLGNVLLADGDKRLLVR